MSHGHHIIPMKTLINTIVALLILTAVTVVAARFDLGSHAINTLVAIVIASVKAYLVASYFMGLKYDSKTHLFVLFTSLLFLALFYSLSAIDVFTRINIESTL